LKENIVSAAELNGTHSPSSSTHSPHHSYSPQSSSSLSSSLKALLRSSDSTTTKNSWTIDKLQAYISYIKQKYSPVITKEAQMVLGGYYRMQRSGDGRNVARTTIRLLESLIRLAQSHVCLEYYFVYIYFFNRFSRFLFFFFC